jgi:hypothetical protein
MPRTLRAARHGEAVFPSLSSRKLSKPTQIFQVIEGIFRFITVHRN